MTKFVRAVTLTAMSMWMALPVWTDGAQQTDAIARRLVEPEDYARFERLEPTVLSPDGRWLAVPVHRVDGTRSLSLYDLSQATSEPSDAVIVEQADAPKFSQDSKWLAYAIVPTEREVEALRKEKKPSRHQARLRRLEDGETIELGEVASFAFGGGGDYLAIRGYPVNTDEAEQAKEDDDTRSSSELVVRSLDVGNSAAFGYVAEIAWRGDGEGSQLALIVETPGGTHSVQLYDPSDRTMRVLDSGEERYSGLAWPESAPDLAVLRAETTANFEHPAHVVLAWKNLDGEATAYAFDPTDVDDFPAGMRIVEHRRPKWSDDRERLFFGIATWHRKPDSERDGESEDEAGELPESPVEAAIEEPADVEVWHSSDERIVAMQRVEKDEDRKANLLAGWDLAHSRFVRIGTDIHENVELLEGGRFAVETSRDRYRFENMFDQSRHDLVLVDTRSGERSRIAESVQYSVSGSATGRYVLYFKDAHYLVYDVQRAQTANLTVDLPTSFVNDEYDTPVRKEKPPWGSGGWTADDTRVLLYDRFDIWAVSPVGEAARKLSSGMDESVCHRALKLDEDAEGFDAARPMYVSLYGEWDKRSGLGRLDLDGSGVERLIYSDKGVRSLSRAKGADVYTFVQESFDDSPDVFVGDATLATARRVTHTNPFQNEFHWTRGELVDYESSWGKKLQGALYYPANYEPGRHYPMIVYVYERLSQNLHRYSLPDERRYYNPAVWTQQGYFVFNPDIAYRDRNPGPSAVACIVPAVETVLQKGLVDRTKIGLVGHSWGGYEASFVPTQTDLFAAAVAGAPLTNFFSMYGTIHWSGGYPETSHFETGQARMGVPYWEDPEAYSRNSPVMFIESLETPMLVFFGDEDGTVDFHQGVELYNYARRAGKHLVMLVYRGEDHGARKRKNQVDYHRRILHWFGHFLKNEPAADWVTKGQTLLEREREVKSLSKSQEQGR